jgi:hypothetical protein
MFKNKNFSIDIEDQDELRIFKNIKKSGIFRVASRTTIFPCAYSIIWILNIYIYIYMKDIYVCNTRKEPIASFQLEYLAIFYHIEKGIKSWKKKSSMSLNTHPKTCSPYGTRNTSNSSISPREGTPRSL